ncbi:MAG: LysR family transcriptional regulator [Alphaproteobacteria bacterium]|nr:LysR family transcriptional regulator [Alphaproteobacteria bacterium]
MTSASEKIALDLESTPRFRNFDWEKAKNFYYVAKCGSFASAARFLNISQSALSRQVIYLEQQLGCPLFSRHSGGVKLTRKGKELTSIVETTFLSFKGFTRNTFVTIDEGKKRKIRISTTHAVASYILSKLIFAYSKGHPEFVFELISDDHLIDIVLNDVDIAIRPYDSETKGIQQDHLFTLEKKLYASPQYLKEYGEPQTIEELKRHHLIAFGHPEVHPYADVNWILRLGMPAGELHEPVFTSNSVECMIEAAKNGMGVIGSYEEFNILRTARLKNILPDIKDKKIQWYFVYPNYLKKDMKVIELKDYLQKNLLINNISAT